MTIPPPPDAGITSSVVTEINPYVKDGLIASVLGGIAMAARILLSTKPVSFGFVLRRFLAAGLTATVVGLGTRDYFTSTGLWLGVVGGSGYAAPEIADYFLRYLKARGDRKIKSVQRSGKKKRKPRSSGRR